MRADIMSYKLERINKSRGTYGTSSAQADEERAQRIQRLAKLAAGTSDEDPRRSRFKRNKGTIFTLLSFGAIGAVLLAARRLNPEIEMGSVISMYGLVFLGCVIMMVVGRRMRK